MSEPVPNPGGNALFLVCSPCFNAGKPDHGVRLASRTLVGYYDADAPHKTLNGWFQKHAKCGGRTEPDHFRLGHVFQPNHDMDRIKKPELSVVE